MNDAEKLSELLDVVRRCYDHCGYLRNRSVSELVELAKKEADEIQQALANGDRANLTEELGDMLYGVLLTAHAAEQQGKATFSEVVDGVIEKLQRRKPFVFEGRTVSEADAWTYWLAAKKEEKIKSGKS